MSKILRVVTTDLDKYQLVTISKTSFKDFFLNKIPASNTEPQLPQWTCDRVFIELDVRGTIHQFLTSSSYIIHLKKCYTSSF